MKNSFFTNILSTLSLLLIIHTSGIAQEQKPQYDAVSKLIQEKFNAGQAKEIYELSADVFRSKMTAEQFVEGMNKFKTKSGEWKTFSYREDNEKGRDYLAEFVNGNQIFSLKLDTQGKITRMNFAALQQVEKVKDFQVKSNNPLKDSVDQRIEKLIRPYIQKAITAGLVIAVIDKGQLRRYSYGTVNRQIQQLPDPAATIFEIGSITKTFNALLLAQQVVAGKMKLDDPISKYFPASFPKFQYLGNSVTLKQLANHTSGFPRLPKNIFNGNIDRQDPYKHYRKDSLYRFLKTYHADTKPGSTFAYSNLGAGILSAILEQNTGKGFEQLIVDQIAKPLGMTHTKLTLNGEELKAFAQGYNEEGQPTSAWDLASLKGSGAIRSTLDDMVLYAKAQLGAKGPLSKAISLSQQRTFSSTAQDMALGWRINQGPTATYLHHSGGTGGCRSYIGFDKERQFAVVILSNAAEDVTPLGESLLKK